MSKNFNIPSKMIVLDGITYSEDNLDVPFSGIHNWVADDDIDIESVYENGIQISQKNSRNGIDESKTIFKGRESKEVIIYDNNGKVEIKNQIVNGKLEGLTEVFSDGILLMSTEFKNGKKNGSSIFFNTDGSVSKREYYIDDIKQDEL